jgi:hypothetical protein
MQIIIYGSKDFFYIELFYSIVAYALLHTLD